MSLSSPTNTNHPPAARTHAGGFVRSLLCLTSCLCFVWMFGCTPPGGGGDGPAPPEGTTPIDGPGTGGTETDPDAFSFLSPIDSHAITLFELLDEDDVNVAQWVGETLLPEAYEGVMRAPSGVLAGLMGNDIDRCLAVRHLLSAGGIESRYVVSGEACTVEAMIGGEVVRVATSPYDTDPIADDAIRRIVEHRAADPDVIIAMPDRAVDAGLFRNAFGWYEINQRTGYTTAVGSDGLHVAGAAVSRGGKVAGLWVGVESVMGSFSECAVPSCGDDLEEIIQNICGSIQLDASTWSTIYLNFISTILPAIDGAILAQSFQNGATLVEAACAGGIAAAEA